MGRTAESLIWRMLGQPAWPVDSDATSAHIVMGRIGVIVGALAAVGLARIYASEILALVRGIPVHGDLPRRAVR